MTKRDYIAIAAIINEAQSERECCMLTDISARLAAYFAVDNGRFNRQRFLDACEGTL